MPTGTIDFIALDDLLPLLPGTTLGSAGIDLSLVTAQVKAPMAIDAGGDLTFTVDAGTTVTLQAINASHPTDPDGVVGRADTPAADLGAQLILTADQAWLKYRADARVSPAAAMSGGWFDGNVEAAAAIACADYRRHDKDAILAAAVTSDVRRGPRFAVSLADVGDLDPGDAVSMDVTGALQASVTISWSDIFTSQVGALTRAVSATSPIAIRSSAGATVTTAVSLADTFLLVFSRQDDGRWRVGLKKGRSRTVAAGAGAGLTVEIANPDDVTRILDGVLSDLLGAAHGQIRALVGKSGLDDEDLTRFADVFARLGLPAIPTPADLAQALDALEADVRERLHTVVREKVSLAFAYEYNRVSSESTLFQALLTAPALERHHAAICRGSLNEIIAAILAQPPAADGAVAVERYLNEQTVRTSHAYGFTLGVGKWQIAGKDRRELTVVSRTSLDRQHEQRSYLGFGSYTGEVFGETKTWQVDFSADMPRFSAGRVPRLNEYTLGVTLSYEETNRTFDARDLEQAVDIAVLWSICRPEDHAALAAALEAARGRTRVSWAAQIRVNDEAVRAILPIMAAGTRAQFAGAMAGALRRHGDLGIADVQRRRHLYQPVWAFYLEARDRPTPRDVAAVAIRHLRAEAPLAARGEERFDAYDGLLTAAGTCRLNANTRAVADDFLRGARGITAAIRRNDEDVSVLRDAYKKMRALWKQSHHVRALGARLVEAAGEASVVKGVERTLTIALDGQSIVVSSNVPGTL